MYQLKQCLGVDLGFNSVKIVELAVGRNGVRTVRAASTPTGATPGMSSDEVNQAIVAAAKELIKKGRFSTKKAVFAISGQKVFVRRFRLPKTSDERLARMIQYEARQQIPFPLDKTILQFQHRELPEESEVEVLLVAVRSDEVRNYMHLVNRTGLTPVAIGISSFSLFNAHQFINLDEQEQKKLFEERRGSKKTGGKSKFSLPFMKKGKEAQPEPVAEEAEEAAEDEFQFEEVKGLINFGATSYDLAIGRSGKGEASVGFIRTVPRGGNEMTQAIMRSLNVESFHDAERIKQSSTKLMTFAFDFEEEGETNQEASMAVTDVADKMVTEIRRSLDFFITQPDGMAIDSVVISGGQALLPGMDSYLEEKLTVPVTVVKDPPEHSPLDWQDSFGPQTQYMISIGLALQGMALAPIQVDFLPEERKIVRDFPYRVAAVMILLVAATAAVASQAGQDYASKYEQKSRELQDVMVQARSLNEAYNQAQAVQDEVAEDYLALDKAFGQRHFWLDVLEGIAEVKPPGVLLLDVEMNHDGFLRIRAESDVQVDAAEFNDALKKRFEGRLLADEETGETSIIEEAYTPPLQAGGEQPATRFTFRMEFEDKVNHLKITPTPAPTPVGGRRGSYNERRGRGTQGQPPGGIPYF